jgi:hypothetical protein
MAHFEPGGVFFAWSVGCAAQHSHTPQYDLFFVTRVSLNHLDEPSDSPIFRFTKRLNAGDGNTMRTVLTLIIWWFSANLVIAAIWTCYCMWPRQRSHSRLERIRRGARIVHRHP